MIGPLLFRSFLRGGPHGAGRTAYPEKYTEYIAILGTAVKPVLNRIPVVDDRFHIPQDETIHISNRFKGLEGHALSVETRLSTGMAEAG
jgi:hypothetical protein